MTAVLGKTQVGRTTAEKHGMTMTEHDTTVSAVWAINTVNRADAGHLRSPIFEISGIQNSETVRVCTEQFISQEVEGDEDSPHIELALGNTDNMAELTADQARAIAHALIVEASRLDLITQ
jgi:hypothetical protein